MPKFLRNLVRVDDKGVTMRHRLNGERAYLVNPDHSSDEASASLLNRSIFLTVVLILICFGIYSLLTTWTMGDYLNYRQSPETTIYAPAAICGAIVTVMILRYVNIMYRSPLAISIPRDLFGKVERDDSRLLFLAHANGELESALKSLRRSLAENDQKGVPETREGPSDES